MGATDRQEVDQGSPEDGFSYWVNEIRRHRWVEVYLPNRQSPKVVAYIQRWPSAVDVVAVFITSAVDSVAYRAPMDVRDDPLRPQTLSWVYASSAVWCIRAALALPGPGMPGEIPALIEGDQVPPMVRQLAEYTATGRTIRPAAGSRSAETRTS